MPDHEVTRLSIVNRFCQSCEQWIKSDPDHIVAIHCKAGKGRSGFMTACLLLYLGMCNTATEAIEFFDQKRKIRNVSESCVQSPSQRRYIEYYCSALQQKVAANIPQPLIFLKDITIGPIVGGCHPGISISTNGTKLVDLQNPELYISPASPLKIKLKNVGVSGDVKLQVFDIGIVFEQEVFFFYFHTMFLSDSTALRLEKADLDIACKDTTSSRFPDDFAITLRFGTEIDTNVSSSESVDSIDNLEDELDAVIDSLREDDEAVETAEAAKAVGAVEAVGTVEAAKAVEIVKAVETAEQTDTPTAIVPLVSSPTTSQPLTQVPQLQPQPQPEPQSEPLSDTPFQSKPQSQPQPQLTSLSTPLFQSEPQLQPQPQPQLTSLSAPLLLQSEAQQQSQPQREVPQTAAAVATADDELLDGVLDDVDMNEINQMAGLLPDNVDEIDISDIINDLPQ